MPVVLLPRFPLLHNSDELHLLGPPSPRFHPGHSARLSLCLLFFFFLTQTSTLPKYQLPTNVTLTLHHEYQWTVRWWGSDGSGPSPYSAAALFGVGPDTEADWGKAEWLGGSDQRRLQANFTLSKAVRQARAYVVSPGCHTFATNGQPVSQAQGIMCPWLQFPARMVYDTHNLTSALTMGPNVVEILLGHGFYGAAPTARVLIHGFYADGTEFSVVSTSSRKGNITCVVWPLVCNFFSVVSLMPRCFLLPLPHRWAAQPGPYTRDDPFEGATIDWRLAGSTDWSPMSPLSPQPSVPLITPMLMPNYVISQVITAVDMTILPNGHAVYDFGVNIVGVSSLRVKGPNGAVVTLVVGYCSFAHCFLHCDEGRLWPAASLSALHHTLSHRSFSLFLCSMVNEYWPTALSM